MKTMINLVSSVIKKIGLFLDTLCTELSHLLHSSGCLVSSFLDHLILILSSHRLNPFWIQLGYYVIFSLMGFLALKASSKPRSLGISKPRDIDVYFTSVSALTVSSMSTIEMEVFSDFQLVVLIVLILLGGEAFMNMLRLQFVELKSVRNNKIGSHRVLARTSRAAHARSVPADSGASKSDINNAELGLIITNPQEPAAVKMELSSDHQLMIKSPETQNDGQHLRELEEYKASAMRCLGNMALGYFVAVHLVGSSLVALYINFSPSAKQVLENKGLRTGTFSVFAAVSSLANCGFIPTNENMIVFKKNKGLLLILIPQVLVAGTLYPPCLRLVIFLAERLTGRPELGYILKNGKELGNNCHLLSKPRSCFLGGTVLGLIAIQFIVFVSMEWNSGVMDGLNWDEKLVAAFFQVSNTRHAGESVFDLSTVSPAVLALFVVMMYLPPYTSFLPVEYDDNTNNNTVEKTCGRRTRKRKYAEYLLFSHPTYLAIFLILICITERHNLKEDPLNFNVFNIVIEVIAAYGNVGYTMGYSCKRRVKPDGLCKDAYYGFAGRWSDSGKLILIVVMFFGRLKNFRARGGTAWKL